MRGSKARPPLAPKAVQPKKKPAEAPKPKPKPKPAPARKAKREAKPPAAAKPSSRSQVRAEKLAAAAGGRKTITLSALLQNNDTVAEAKARAKAKVKAMETKRVATISTQTEDAEVGGALAGEGSGEAATRRPSYMSEIDRSLDPDLIRSGERREALLDSRIRLPGERRAQGPGADPGPSPFRYSAEGKDIERAVVTEVVDSVFSDVLSQLPQRHAFTSLPPALPIRVAPNADMQVRLLVTERVDEALSGALESLKHYRPPAPEERADDVADSTVKLVSSMLLEEEAAKLGSTDFAAEPSRPEAGPDPAAGASAEFRAAPGVPERRRRGRGATASPTGPQVPEVHRYSDPGSDSDDDARARTPSFSYRSGRLPATPPTPATPRPLVIPDFADLPVTPVPDLGATPASAAAPPSAAEEVGEEVAEQVEILDIQRANPVKNPAVVSDSYFASDTSGSSILDVTSDRLTDDSSDDTFS